MAGKNIKRNEKGFGGGVKIKNSVKILLFFVAFSLQIATIFLIFSHKKNDGRKR
jgi:hypothetical protein